ncbi:trifunctional serine/threonine-protein kinase/ATP-binding protein/sensor histidine kinase [Nostoc sp. 'Lobaria pulmonaria (5183) cyanobiont']|uniref:trifunctional serine/threonine-protein kinase/ATP-binding protein/sensor histidine kinase n=1 Tax=Nostoc sp. 'Lobaria pulmonaria (5183) cyanobiont' TaxID=1618022 RepID=UPI000CF31D2B|nr:ATP-binding sensor histidine kinase [Nostoc sp. 'Lobaria pulmonaria (5183) cyanobiont']AVH71701.1 histidine kinase [Nostoc sp. 'Lobaria pulmonaria (5183) cyanobiont']
MFKLIAHIPDYSIRSLIYEAAATVIYRAYSKAKECSVVIKLLKAEYPTIKEIAQLKHEYEIIQNLNIAGVIKAHELINYDNGYNNGLALVLEDFGGETLKHQISTTGVELTKFLNIAEQITETLGELHTHHIIHKDLKPENILYNPNTEKIKLIDFSIASLLSKESPEISSLNLLEGTLAYMSPEQTGRINRTLDYRTDFYSLGVIFYEMLTGQLPFQNAQDPMELVHCHIAKIPVAPHEINPKVPLAISAIAMKLLSKTAEDRYQSAYGLKADLEQAAIQLQTKGSIDLFNLGQQDFSHQFQIAQKLYGREVEVAALMAAFEKVSLGSSEVVLVGGYSGIGKSSLVNEVHKPIVRQRGYFIGGKFDQLKRDIPYASLIQAFRELMRQLLAESQARVEVWKNKLLRALGANGQVIIDVIPEVELIIGQQAPVPQLGVAESQNRFNRVFKQFIHAFTAALHPLVLFLDDLQWADAASVNLVENLMTDPESQYLLLIGAYRDNEVSPTHPLMLMLETIQAFGATVEELLLKPLATPHITQLVTDTFNCESSQAEPLADLLFQKTQGNPFFLTQLLKVLHQDNLLTFDYHSGFWKWDLNKIQSQAITDNVVDLMVNKIQRLSEPTQQVLQLAACVGNRFNLEILAVVNEKSPSATAIDLWEALRAGLILPLSDTYKIPQLLNQSELAIYCNTAVEVDYKFLHDRVQQAAYFLIPTDQQQQVHLKVGKLLLHNTEKAQLEEHLFDIVNHLNAGSSLIVESVERYELAELNLKAGQRAKSSSAFVTALKLLETGMSYLPENSWQDNYLLTLTLYLQSGEAEFLNGKYEEALLIFEQTFSQVQTTLDMCRVNEYRIMCYRMENDLNSAYKIGLNTLELLGLKFTAYPDDAYLLAKLNQTKKIIGDRSTFSLAELPPMQDEEKLMAQRILKEVWPIAYFLGSKALHITSMNITQLSVKYGNSRISVFGYMLYSFNLVFQYGEVDSGYEFGELSLRLHEILRTKELEANILNMWGGLICHYKDHISQAKPYLLKGFNSGLETGSYQWSGYCSVNFLWQSLFGNESLEKTAEIAEDFIPTLRKIDKNMLNYHLLAMEAIANLTKPAGKIDQLLGTWADEQQVLEFALASSDMLSAFVVYIYKLALCNWYGEYIKAVEYAENAEKFVGGARGIFINPVFYFHQSIALAGAYAEADTATQVIYLHKLNANLEKFQQWAMHCPTNYQHKFLLIQAEVARIYQQDYQAMELYDKAIASAAENGYLQNEALANELAFRFYLAKDRTNFAKVYFKEARYRYLKWEATGKVQQLDEQYSQLFTDTVGEVNGRGTATKQIRDISEAKTQTLDLTTAIKASQALSSEMELSRLLEKMMTIAIENAGAQMGYLLVKRENQWVIEAEGSIDRDQLTVRSSSLVQVKHKLPVLLINYVERTKENLVLDDASHTERFVSDNYIIANQPKSVLCSPFAHQGKLTGVLYLENNLTTGAFTAERLEVLNLLTSQVSISIENARLYTNLHIYSQELEISETQAREKAKQLEHTLDELKLTQSQMVQSEKMSSLGQLVAGVAHEINNPVSFIYGNLTYVNNYVKDLMSVVELYQQQNQNLPPKVQNQIDAVDLDFLMEDLPKLLASMQVGTDRIRQIVLSLRNFSRLDEAEVKAVDIHDGIDSTLMILQNRLKPQPDSPGIQVIQEYGNLPPVECYPGQLNQVFMNLLANAIDSLEEFNEHRTYADIARQPSIITIRTTIEGNVAVIRIADNGSGIGENVQTQLFTPFFTTKPVGKGTGLGLSISYQIVTNKHRGQLECVSVLGGGAEFIVSIPLQARLEARSF